MRRQAAIPKKYEHIDFTPPEGVANAAAKGLELRQKASPSNRGGLTSEEAGKQGIGSGVQRAVNLKNRDTISPKVVKQMRGFLSRSEKSSEISAENKSTPWNDKGYVAWLLWGGDPAKAWTDKIIGQMEAADEKGKPSKKAALMVKWGSFLCPSIREAGSDNEPSNPGLWAKVQALTKGEKASITVNGKKGKTYKDLGGEWKKNASSADGFMSDYRSMTFDNFLDPRSRVWSYARDGERLPLIMTEIEPTPYSEAPIWLKSIVSPERQGTGQASAILRKVTDLADKHGVAIWLTPKPFGRVENALSASKLKGWYKRYGWESTYGDVWVRQPAGMSRTARGKAKKGVGHGGLDEWFSGHGGAKGKGEDATWGDWVSISPVTKTLPSGKKVQKGDIVGECGISDDADWKEITKGGEDPLKCMPRQKAYDMPKAERAEKAKAKQRAEKADSSRGKKPTMTPTFDKKKASGISLRVQRIQMKREASARLRIAWREHG